MRTRSWTTAGCLLATGALLLVGCGGPAEPAPDAANAPAGPLRADAEFVGVAADATRDEAMVAASIRLATQLLDLGEPGQDVVVSPASLQLALALLREGASGRVAEEIDAAAGLTGSQAVADLRAALAEYEGDVAGIDPDNPPETPLLHIADSAFVQQDFPVVPEFLERIAAYHAAQVYEVDFIGGNPKPALDAWVADETGGLLTECPLEPVEDTRVVLMDAITFGATWASEFLGADTFDGAFTRADGSTVDAPLMHQTTSIPYARGDGWVAVELPYAEGFTMRLVLPDDGTASAEAWADAHAALDVAEPALLALTLPRWKTDTTLDLTPELEILGLGSLPFPDGDLDGVFTDAYVGGVAQAATITVAEKGTVAAAVTAIDVRLESLPMVPDLQVRFDRPFEYQVVHSGTGMVLFAGRVLDPSEG